MECCVRLPCLHSHLTSYCLGEVGLQSEGKAANKCSAYVGTPSRLLEHFQVKLVERIIRVCKAVIKAKGGYFEESKI